jgi:putative flavoprotein involved in K+ transport
LRLLTPNWQSRLPGYSCHGSSPDGFRTVQETIEYIQHYAEVSSAPVFEHAEVTSVDYSTGASGACNLPSIPPLAGHLPRSIATFTAMDYRNPERLPSGRGHSMCAAVRQLLAN